MAKYEITLNRIVSESFTIEAPDRYTAWKVVEELDTNIIFVHKMLAPAMAGHIGSLDPDHVDTLDPEVKNVDDDKPVTLTSSDLEGYLPEDMMRDVKYNILLNKLKKATQERRWTDVAELACDLDWMEA